MRQSRSAFTLMEMMISISILSIMMLFLYQSYSALNSSNSKYKEKATVIKNERLKSSILYKDFALALSATTKILNQDRRVDVVFMQSANSIHKRHNPYLAYVFKDEKLYRLESLREFKEYPLAADSEFSIDYLGEAESFRVYKSTVKVGAVVPEIYLVHVDFKQEEDVLLKIKTLNEY